MTSSVDLPLPARSNADYWRERAEKAEALVEELADALDGLLAITSDSQGVAGYHLNGAIAEWGEFPEIDACRATLAKVRKP